MPEINTFAFLHLETTGLPSEEFNKTKITEISIVACRKERLLEAKDVDVPRVHHKLTLCVNPCKMISPVASTLSALDNNLLEREAIFDSSAVELIFNFINQLNGPVCLVAHNGMAFDFPILKKEILNCGKEIPKNIFVIDSLPVFRDLDLHRPQSYSLIDIHERFFGEPEYPLRLHSAEDFALTLISCVVNKKENFVHISEANATQFCDVRPLFS